MKAATKKKPATKRPQTAAEYRAKMRDWPKTDVRRERDFILKELQADLSEAISDLMYLTAINAELDSRALAARKAGAK